MLKLSLAVSFIPHYWVIDIWIFHLKTVKQQLQQFKCQDFVVCVFRRLFNTLNLKTSHQSKTISIGDWFLLNDNNNNIHICVYAEYRKLKYTSALRVAERNKHYEITVNAICVFDFWWCIWWLHRIETN